MDKETYNAVGDAYVQEWTKRNCWKKKVERGIEEYLRISNVRLSSSFRIKFTKMIQEMMNKEDY